MLSEIPLSKAPGPILPFSPSLAIPALSPGASDQGRTERRYALVWAYWFGCAAVEFSYTVPIIYNETIRSIHAGMLRLQVSSLPPDTNALWIEKANSELAFAISSWRTH